MCCHYIRPSRAPCTTRNSRSQPRAAPPTASPRQTRVISLYAKGMTTGDIQAHLAEIYGTDISRDTISRITDAVVEDMVGWQNRPLDGSIR